MPALRSTNLALDAVPVRSFQDATRLIGVLDEVWGGSPGSSHLDHGMITALAHAGEYTMVFELHGQAVGAGVGFFGSPRTPALHSHILGVVPSVAGQGVGLAIKQHQRAWCLERGVHEITWTFDPLIGRNAAFNLRKLGARADQYLENFYGAMTDGINSGQATDRLLVRWSLDAPLAPISEYGTVAAWLIEDASGEPVMLSPDPEASRRSIRVPHDVDRLRHEDAELARRWRRAVREALGSAMAEGWSIIGFRSEGDYVVERATE